jgi:SSS family solute:Na+ symporter
MGVMVVFTIPYLAVQAVGAGILIQYVSGAISWQIGAMVTIVVVMLYVMLGGMRGSGWADVFQGVLMITAMTLAVVFVAISLGGFEQANLMAYQANPVLFARPGVGEYFTMQMWFSFMLLWFFVDPMFPQLFSLFYTAKNQKSLKVSMILYPVVVSFFFLFPVLIGVWAHGAGLPIPSGSEDMVLPLMVQRFAPPVLFAFIMTGALAALISTADSQLLSLSTMLSHDLLRLKKRKQEVWYGKMVIVVLSLFTVVFIITGYNPNEGIMGTLVKTTFSGLIVLCPTTLAALYWKRATKYGCMASIVFGELSIVLFHYKLLPDFGFLPGILALLISTVVLVVTCFLFPRKT